MENVLDKSRKMCGKPLEMSLIFEGRTHEIHGRSLKEILLSIIEKIGAQLEKYAEKIQAETSPGARR